MAYCCERCGDGLLTRNTTKYFCDITKKRKDREDFFEKGLKGKVVGLQQ